MSKTIRTRIGDDYEILEELGQGGMAQVFRARHKRLGRIVALKVLPPHLLADAEAQTRFEREAHAGARLEHDHIVTTYDWGIYDGHSYLAVAFIEGETLTQRIHTKGRLSPQETVRLIAPIAEALAYAHRHGVIHRDVKSSNIMIRNEDERPVLIDFGIAQASYTQKLTRRGDAIGTPEYMSPEQAAAHEIDPRSDIYSLGVVLYECLTGTVPFKSPNTEVLLANIRHEPPRLVRDLAPDVPLWLANVVDRCVAKKPVDRFDDGKALAKALRAGNNPKTAPPKHKPVSKTIWVAGLVLALLIFVGVGYTAGWFDALVNPQEQTDAESLFRQAEAVYNAQDYAKALQLFQEAADQGHASAQYKLGWMYENGRGTPPNDTKAASWYGKAAEQGHDDAYLALQRLQEQATATLSGRVTDAETGIGLAGAGVIVTDANQGTTTDTRGYYLIKDLTPGSYTILVHADGYESSHQAPRLEAGHTHALNVRLTPERHVDIRAGSFRNDFRGTISPKIQIRMTLVCDGQHLSGTYYYVVAGKNIDAQGECDVDGNVTIRGFFDNKMIDLFQGRFTSAGTITGMWFKPGSDKRRSFILTTIN